MATVLVIEDDPDMREIERATLECAGHSVVLASNGREGLDVLERGRRPCMILLDLMMPIMDGLTFLAERRKRRWEDVPVVCVTAGGEEMLQDALKLGARECMEKPADFDALCDRVRHYCG